MRAQRSDLRTTHALRLRGDANVRMEGLELRCIIEKTCIGQSKVLQT
jgi:hypothetical protein